MKALFIALLAIAVWPDFATAQAKVSTLSASTGINLNSVNVALQTQVPGKFAFVYARPKRYLAGAAADCALDITLGSSIWDASLKDTEGGAGIVDWFFDLPDTYSGGGITVLINECGAVTPSTASNWRSTVTATLSVNGNISALANGAHLNTANNVAVSSLLSRETRTTTGLAGATLLFLRIRRDSSYTDDNYETDLLVHPILKVPLKDMNGN